MKKPNYLKKFKFDSFPSECYLKTYLGDRALIVNYNNNYDTVSVWLENETFINMCHKIDLQASEEEISKAWDLLCNKIEYSKPMTGVGWSRVQIGGFPASPRRSVIPPTTSPTELEVQRTPFDECDCDSCREQRERILEERQTQAAVDVGAEVVYSLPISLYTPEQDSPMTYDERMVHLIKSYTGMRPGSINIRTGDTIDEHN